MEKSYKGNAIILIWKNKPSSEQELRINELNANGYKQYSRASMIEFLPPQNNVNPFDKAKQFGLELRIAKEKDLKEIEMLFNACFDTLADDLPTQIELLNQIKSGMVYVLTLDNKIVGTNTLEIKGSRVTMWHSCVSPSQQGKGFGSIIIIHLGRYIAQKENKKLCCWLIETNKNAEKFYKKFGIRETAMYSTIYVKEGE